jgi:formylglycine-generating enzyme required for sulfatase activity
VVLGVLTAQIALAGGGQPAGTITISENDLRELIRQEVARTLAAKAAKKKTKRGPPGPQGPAGLPGSQGAQGQQGTQGPAGSAPACAGNGSGDTMVAAGAVCIDKYEVSIWNSAEGGTQITGAIPCNVNGQDCTNIFARSVPGVTPRASITWFQAQQALANVGKRLPTNAEWQQAVAGTPDPGITDNGTSDCNVVAAGAAVNTGSRSNCASRFGANDMVGNLQEWVADWDEEAGGCANWPAGFGTDQTCLGRADTQASSRFPGALIRGGSFASVTTNAGPFAVDGVFQPSFSNIDIGFRGAR